MDGERDLYRDDYGEIEDYEGTVVKAYDFRCLIEGDRDEIFEFGKYVGTQYKSVRYRCNGRYYRVPEIMLDYSEKCEMTKDGYAIVSNAEINPLEDGLYIIGDYLVEVKN